MPSVLSALPDSSFALRMQAAQGSANGKKLVEAIPAEARLSMLKKLASEGEDPSELIHIMDLRAIAFVLDGITWATSILAHVDNAVLCAVSDMVPDSGNMARSVVEVMLLKTTRELQLLLEKNTFSPTVMKTLLLNELL